MIINSNIKRSASYGLIIKEEDVELERKIVYETFLKYYKDIKTMKWNDYERLQRKIFMDVFSLLNEQIEYYFSNTPERETRTRYQLHLEYIVTDIFRYLTSEKESVQNDIDPYGEENWEEETLWQKPIR